RRTVRGPLSAQMIAALALWYARHTSAEGVDAARDLVTAAVDGRFVVGRRFEARERLDRREQPLALGAAEIPESYNRRHAARVDCRRRVANASAAARSGHALTAAAAHPAGAAGANARSARATIARRAASAVRGVRERTDRSAAWRA